MPSAAGTITRPLIGVWLTGLLLLSGCATRPIETGATGDAMPAWSGRLVLRIASEPPQAINAGFELQGSASAGSLVLTSTLGQIAARLQWSPKRATLQHAGQSEQVYASLDQLTQQAGAAELPVAALFDWLAGVNTLAAGWQANLEHLSQGRLAGHREVPPPQADLLLMLDLPAAN